MDDSVIPPDVRRFLLSHIDSIAQWEGLLLLRSRPGKARDIGAIARDLYISDAEAGQVLTQLAQRRVLAESETPSGRTYVYAPETADIDALIGRAADLYRQYLIPVTHIIHSRQTTRVQEFANAFRMRKD